MATIPIGADRTLATRRAARRSLGVLRQAPLIPLVILIVLVSVAVLAVRCCREPTRTSGVGAVGADRPHKRSREPMTKVLECAKVDPSSGCQHVVRGETEDEVLRNAGEHAKEHGDEGAASHHSSEQGNHHE